VPKAAILGETAGVVKVVAERGSGRLLGVHVCGAGAADMIQVAVIAIQSFDKDVAKMSCCAE